MISNSKIIMKKEKIKKGEMRNMTEMKKIMAMTVVIAMACASLVVVMPNNTVIAEDSAKPLTGLDNEYPAFEDVLDVSQDLTDMTYPILFGSDQYGSQSFQPLSDGDLSMFEFRLSYLTYPDGGMLGYDIRVGDPPNPASTLIGGFQWVALSDLDVGWNAITLSSTVPVSIGTTYQIVLTVSDSSRVDWDYKSGDPYASGTGRTSASDTGYSTLGGDWTFRTYLAVPTDGLAKVAWHESGDYALGVTGYDDHIYKYTRQTSTWSSEKNLAGGNVFNDIKYSSNFNLFYIVGTGSVPLGFSYYEPAQSLANLNAPFDGGAYFNGLCLADENGAEDFAFLAVGYNSNTNDPYAAWYNQSSHIWTVVNSGWSGADENLYDVTWDHGATGNPYYAVGKDYGTGMGVVYYFTTTGNNTANSLELNGWMPGPLFGIDWQPAGTADHAVIVGALYSYGNVWVFNGSFGETILNNSYILNDVCFHPDGSMAMIVGETNSFDEGVIYHYYPDSSATKMSTDGTLDSLNGVSVKGWTSPSSGLIVGSSGAVGSYLSSSDGETTITVNAAFPHMYTIDMWKTSDAGETSTLNARVDAEETYTFYTEINYTIGGTDELFDVGNVNNTFVDLTAWFDDGDDSTSLIPPASDDDRRTRKFVARFYEGTAGTGGVSGSIIYPDTTTNEILLDGVGCSGPFGGDDRYGVWINVTFGAQMRAADGQNFAFGAAGDIFDSNQAFDDDDSWNFQMEVYDNDFPGATNSTYEEFGIFMATNITVSNNPSVNAPPGSVSMPFDSNSLITYSANIPYYVNVSIERLNLTTDDSKFIPASNVNVSLVDAYPAGFDLEPYTEINSTWGAAGRPFAAANTEYMVWGNTSQATELVPAPNNGTAAHGPIYSNFDGYGATEVSWWVSVPGGTDEGIYQATITFKIGYY